MSIRNPAQSHSYHSFGELQVGIADIFMIQEQSQGAVSKFKIQNLMYV